MLVWGGASKLQAAAKTPKRANSPKGCEANDSRTLLRLTNKQEPGICPAPAFASLPQRKGGKSEAP